MMRDVHSLECPRCKMRERFYAEFNCDTKRNVAYFGIITYTNYLMPKSSEEPKEKISTEAQCCRQSNVSLLHLKNKQTDKQPVQKPIEKKKELEHYFNEDKNLFSRCVEKTPDSNLPVCSRKYACSSISVKNSESFHESSSDDKVSSDNLETAINIDKLTKKSLSKKKTGAKEPKLGTLKRKRWNWDKLQPSESYEDDLFEEKKLQRIRLEESSNRISKAPSYSTPCWSVQLSPKELSTTPCYEDCYSPAELQSIRKEAEEYQYRRNKRRKHRPEKTKDSKTEVKKEYDSYSIIKAASRVLETLAEKDCGVEEDSYFSNEEFDGKGE